MSLEKDITLIKKLVEANIFKPAEPDEVERREAEKRAAYEKLNGERLARKEDVCPHCGADLRDENRYGVYEKGTEEYSQNLGWSVQHEVWEFGDTGPEIGNQTTEGYFCGNCNEKLRSGIDFDLGHTL